MNLEMHCWISRYKQDTWSTKYMGYKYMEWDTNIWNEIQLCGMRYMEYDDITHSLI